MWTPYSNIPSHFILLPLSPASMTDMDRKKKRPRSTVNMNQLKYGNLILITLFEFESKRPIGQLHLTVQALGMASQ